MSEQPAVPELPTKTAPEAVEVVSGADILNAPEEFPQAVNPAELQAMKENLRDEALLSIARSMERMMERQESVRQVPYNELKPVSPWNPEGKRERLKFTRPTYQHGILVNDFQCSEQTIKLFNQLKPGRYLDRKIEVQLLQDGSLNVQWEGGKLDRRIEFYSQFRHIDDVLQAIIIERKDREEQKRRGVVSDSDVL